MIDFTAVSDLRVQIFCDCANREQILEMARKPFVAGFTTNPTLLRKAGVVSFDRFARDILTEISDRPFSFEVFADDFEGMRRQALTIAGWGKNVFVKIPVSNTKGEPTYSLIEDLSHRGVKLNVTAIMHPTQIRQVVDHLNPDVDAIVSIFAGRIADTGRDPLPIMRMATEYVRERPKIKTLWASPRELLNIFHADEAGTDIITVTADLLSKLSLVGKDLYEFSRETVQMFHTDAVVSQCSIEIAPML